MLSGSTDSDGDGISDTVEAGDDLAHPVDTDSDGTIDALDEDSDNDGMLDTHEHIAGTDSTDSSSIFAVTTLQREAWTNFVLTWSSVSGKYYGVYATSNLFDEFAPLRTNIHATPTKNTYTDVLDNAVQRFYRINVEE